MFCNNCGTKLDDIARFCPNCGNLVAPVQPVQEPMENPYAPVQPVQESVENPYAPVQPVQESVENPYAPVQPVQEPVENPYAPVQSVVPNSFDTPVQSGVDGQQWSPLMQPEKKNKKGLIIGLCAGLAVVLVVIIVVCILIFTSDKKSDNESNKDNTKQETTEEQLENKPVDVSSAVELLMTQYFEAVKANDMDAYKDLWLDEAFADLIEYYPEDSYTDEEIIQYTSEIDSDFGIVQKVEVSELQVSDYAESFLSDYYIEKYNLQAVSIENATEINGIVKLTSDAREASFEFYMDFGIVNGEWKIISFYIDLYSFTDYQYTFTGNGDDKFKQWYDLDSEEPTEDESDDPDESNDPSDLTDVDISGFEVADAGSDSVDSLADAAFKAFLSYDYDSSIKTFVPAMGAYFNYIVDSGLLTKDDVIEELLSDDITTTANFKSYDYESVDLSSSELQEYNDVITEYKVGDICDKGITTTGTLTYEVSGAKKEITAELVILHSGNKWYVVDIYIDGTIE